MRDCGDGKTKTQKKGKNSLLGYVVYMENMKTHFKLQNVNIAHAKGKRRNAKVKKKRANKLLHSLYSAL